MNSCGGVVFPFYPGDRFALIFSNPHMFGQAQHFKQAGCLAVNLTKNQPSPALLGRVDYAHKNRDADAVDQFGVPKINDDPVLSGFELALALAFDAFAAQLVEIIAGVNDRRVTDTARLDETMTVKLRYKQPEGGQSTLMSVTVPAKTASNPALGFAAAVAQFGMLLRDSEFKGQSSFASTRALAARFKGLDPHGHRAEFIRLIDAAESVEELRRTK